MITRRWWRAVVAASVASVIGVAALALWVRRPLPEGMLAPVPRGNVQLLDRTGRPLRVARASDGTLTRWVPYARMNVDLINAFVAVEDHRFWEHHGIDARAIARAASDAVRRRRVVSGASTITMQLARLVAPAPRTVIGKASQALWAMRLEQQLSKQQILEQYLNRVELGQGTAGVAAASAYYFDAAQGSLSIAQAATLAGIAHAPSRENPLVAPARARSRRSYALRRLHALGYATAADVERARSEPLAALQHGSPFLAPHFAARLLSGSAADSARDGRLFTTLDLALQTIIEGEVRHAVATLRDRGVEDAAAVVLDNRTGEVLAWVGSPDFNAPGDGQTDMVVSPRQPGSALKPFLYAYAFDHGTTPATVLPDIPRVYAAATGSYMPRNYDRRFHGPVRAREALASSYNVPAVELASRVGTANLLSVLHDAGFATLDRDAEYYGLGLALGNGDVSLLALANGYRALANGGRWTPWHWRPQAMTRGAAANGEGRRVVSPMAASLVLDVLADPSARIPGFGAVTPFEFPFPVAVKTGTSRHFTDNWAVAVAGNFVAAVWAGNFSGRPMQGVSGVTGAGPLLARVVIETSRRYPPGALVTPQSLGATPVNVCRLSGMRATAQCTQLTEWFAPGTAPTAVDDWQRDGRVRLPAEYTQGAMAQAPASPAVTLASTPMETRDAMASSSTRTAEVSEKSFRITAPHDGDRYGIPPGVEAQYATIALHAVGPATPNVRWTVDGLPVSGSRWPLREGVHVIRAASGGATDRVTITVLR